MIPDVTDYHQDIKEPMTASINTKKLNKLTSFNSSHSAMKTVKNGKRNQK